MADSDCGIGTPAGYTGPCNGRFKASDAGAGQIGTLHSAPVVSALVGCGALLAALLFAVFVSRAVGGFFSGRNAARLARQREGSSPLFSERVAEYLAEHPARDAGKGDRNDLDGPADVEFDAEDDTESEIDEEEWETDSPGYRRKFE